jgi:hypothetical protein
MEKRINEDRLNDGDKHAIKTLIDGIKAGSITELVEVCLGIGTAYPSKFHKEITSTVMTGWHIRGLPEQLR